jgi:hypothetical protein
MIRTNRLVNARELKRQYELEPRRCVAQLTEALESRALAPENFSVRDLFESFLGAEALAAISFRRSGGTPIAVLEANQAVDTAAFSNITGQIVYSKIRQGYENPAFLWPQLCETVPTSFLDGEKIPGVGPTGDKAETVAEGDAYPTFGLTEEFLETVRLVKRGFIVPVTREIVVADRTGLVLKVADEGGKWLGYNKEKRVIDAAVGVTNNYKRNGVATNTYLTAGAYVNSQTGNTLVDWTNIEKAELLFDALTDPNTGEPIVMPPNLQLLVPSALKYTSKRIVSATEIRFGDGAANTTQAISGNPVPNYSILSSPYVKLRTGSATTWFLGAFREALAYMEAWGIETLKAAANSEAEFTNDIVARFKVSEMGAAQVMEPRKVCKNAP